MLTTENGGVRLLDKHELKNKSLERTTFLISSIFSGGIHRSIYLDEKYPLTLTCNYVREASKNFLPLSIAVVAVTSEHK